MVEVRGGDGHVLAQVPELVAVGIGKPEAFGHPGPRSPAALVFVS